MVEDNVINFRKAKFIRDISNNRFLKVMSVKADSVTGEWITTPEHTNKMVSEVYWKNQENTSKQSHEFIKVDEEDYALIIYWESLE